MRIVALAALASLSSTGCGGAPRAPQPEAELAASGVLELVAEGPCPRLSMRAVGDARWLIYGDTGYDLRGWLPGDELAAAQSLAVLAPGGPGLAPAWLAGLPRDARGYVPASLELGGNSPERAWLLRIETRYAPGGTGALFERRAEGYTRGPSGWESRGGGSSVELPLGARSLPELPQAELCDRGLHFVPLASAVSPEGGVVIAGRCDDDAPQNLPDPVVVVAHGRRGTARWQIGRAPGVGDLDGIVNLELDALSDDDVRMVAWEPMKPADRRGTYLAGFDGRSWRTLPPPVEAPLLSVARTSDGTAYFATGRSLVEVDTRGRARELSLPAPRYARGEPRERMVRRVSTVGMELWVETAYRVEPEGEGDPIWASALHSNRALGAHLYCDARLPADEALFIVDDAARVR